MAYRVSLVGACVGALVGDVCRVVALFRFLGSLTSPTLLGVVGAGPSRAAAPLPEGRPPTHHQRTRFAGRSTISDEPDRYPIKGVASGCFGVSVWR